MTSPNIINVYPSNGAQGIPIGDSISVTFDQEMDLSSINSGTFVVSGPDNGIFFTGEIDPWQEPGFSDQDILNSPYYGGKVEGTITFQKVDASGSPVDDSAVDYDGDRTLWRTVAVFTPNSPFAPNKEYTVIIGGDEDQTNDFDSGVKNRTVFDANPTSVSGTGTIEFSGGYSGSNERTYTVKITSGGQTGNATYEWWNNAYPLVVYSGVTTTGLRELEDGICVTFGKDGTFSTNDTWTVKVLPYELMSNNYRWTFSTGSGQITVPPSTSSASGIADLETSTFSVTETDPESGKYYVPISTDPYSGETITITFSANIDESSLINNIFIESDACNGDPKIEHTGELDFSYGISGTVLTIILDPGQLFQNNIVVITLDKSISDTDGNTLDEDYTYYFATEYTPLYTSLRRIVLDMGDLLTDVPEETIMLAIFEASLQADAMKFTTSITNSKFYNFARKEYTTCLAESILIRGMLSDGRFSNDMSKRLADLTVSRGGIGEELRNRLDDLKDCVSKYEIVIKTGGSVGPNASLHPTTSVKGANASDAIKVSRLWEPSSSVNHYSPSANTRVDTNNSRRQLRTHRRRNWRS